MTAASRSEPIKATPSEYVLPAPPRAHPDLLVAPVTMLPGWALAHETRAVRGLGERLCELLDCQTRFHAELRASLAELTTDIPEGTRAHLLGQVRVLGEILDWCGAVHQDLLVEANRAVLGQRPIDLVDFVREVALDWTAANHVQVAVHGSCHQPWWGKPIGRASCRERVYDDV